MPRLNLGKIELTEADLVARQLADEKTASDSAFLARGATVKKIPLNHLPGEDGGATPVYLVDETSDLSEYSAGDILVVIPAQERQTVFLGFGSSEPFTLSVEKPGWDGRLQYSHDLLSWSTWDGSEISAERMDGDSGDPSYYLLLRGRNNTVITGATTSDGSAWKLTPSGSAGIECGGYAEALLDWKKLKNGEYPTMGARAFAYLFQGNDALLNAPGLISKTLSVECYRGMFRYCTALAEAPELPATELAGGCYYDMFNGCTALTEAPELPATELAINCYRGMFNGCTRLTKAPALPSKAMASGCYRYMFWSSGLTASPALPATTLADGCYYGMLQRCAELTSLPALPATELASECYAYMFYKCSKIQLSAEQTDDYQNTYRIPMEGEGVMAENAVNDMFYGTGGTFAAAPEINTTYYTSAQVI